MSSAPLSVSVDAFLGMLRCGRPELVTVSARSCWWFRSSVGRRVVWRRSLTKTVTQAAMGGL